MAVGEIQIFVSTPSKVPIGWLLCDGRLLEKKEYRLLANFLFDEETGLYIYGSEGSKFRLPDFRGIFLRGADQGSRRDPDRQERSSLYQEGNTGESVGSYQKGSIQSHKHTMTQSGNHDHGLGMRIYGASSGRYAFYGGYGGWHRSDYGGQHAHAIRSFGGHETRPDNVYVNYIIKT